MFNKKTFFTFIFGAIFGLFVTMSIGTINIQKNKGRPLYQPRNFGNIRIIPTTVDPLIVPNAYKAMLIDRDGEFFLHLYFDKQDKLQKLIYLDGEESLFEVNLPEGGAEYGHVMDPRYKDIDRNGSFDIIWVEGRPGIVVDNHRIEVSGINYNQEEATVKEGNEDVLYVFEFNKGWIRK